VGGIKTIQNGQTLTFLFTETNKGSRSAPEDLVLTEVTNATVVGGLTCVLPNGFAINADGFFCEPGLVSPGRSASSVITTNVTGSVTQRIGTSIASAPRAIVRAEPVRLNRTLKATAPPAKKLVKEKCIFLQ